MQPAEEYKHLRDFLRDGRTFLVVRVVLSTPTACVGSLHSTPTLVKPFLQEWREEFEWANMDFPVQSGLKCQRKVMVLSAT